MRQTFSATFAVYTHPTYGVVHVRLDGRLPQTWHDRGGWRFGGTTTVRKGGRS